MFFHFFPETRHYFRKEALQTSEANRRQHSTQLFRWWQDFNYKSGCSQVNFMFHADERSTLYSKVRQKYEQWVTKWEQKLAIQIKCFRDTVFQNQSPPCGLCKMANTFIVVFFIFWMNVMGFHSNRHQAVKVFFICSCSCNFYSTAKKTFFTLSMIREAELWVGPQNLSKGRIWVWWLVKSSDGIKW